MNADNHDYSTSSNKCGGNSKDNDAITTVTTAAKTKQNTTISILMIMRMIMLMIIIIIDIPTMYIRRHTNVWQYGGTVKAARRLQGGLHSGRHGGQTA